MALEDALEGLTAALAEQTAAQQALVAKLNDTEQVREKRAEEFLRALRSLVDHIDDNQGRLSGQLGSLMGAFSTSQNLLGAAATSTGDASAKTVKALEALAEQSAKFETAAQTFNAAATQTQQSASELTELVGLMRLQAQQQHLGIEQQNLSLKYQNEAIQATLRIARENSRSTWVQNWLFFFLGLLIPIVVQLVFRFF